MIKLTKAKVKEILGTKLMGVGTDIINDAEYVKYLKGASGLDLVLARYKELGVKIKLEDIKNMGMYNNGFRSLMVIIPAEVFKWKKDEVREMGSSSFKLSFLTKLFAKYFMTVESIVQQAGIHWTRHVSEPSRLTIHPHLKDKRMVVHIENYDMHPLMLNYLEGYFKALLEFCLNDKKVSVKLVKSVNANHEFKASWK